MIYPNPQYQIIDTPKRFDRFAKERRLTQAVRIVIAKGKVTEDGQLRDVTVLCTEPLGLNEDEIRERLSLWRLRPARKDGKAVEYRDFLIYYNSAVPIIDRETCTIRALSPQPITLAGQPLLNPGDVMESVPPLYPVSAHDTGTSGSVVVTFTLSAEGYLIEPTIECATSKSFAKSALRVAERWRYLVSPSFYAKYPKQRYCILFEFKLSDDE